MPESAQDLLNQIQSPAVEDGFNPVLRLAIYLAIGGALAIYIRFLYRFTAKPASTDSIARVFPLLTLVTVAIIAVVKSSLALSLGLVGALSIVRFRAAIKDPEELVYLFLCIGVGLSLGAEQPEIAGVLVAVATVFALGFDRLRPGARRGDAYLTIVGDASTYFADREGDAVNILRAAFPNFTVQRCDIEGDEGQLRVQLHRVDGPAAPELVASLRQQMPGCQVSYVAAESML